ncbi:DUF3405 domain-containing protein [Belnapia rosea]|uniref:DUF3405 domain-containing protein n=1 Tax=Belnapia rosea TaxID=938405 RepID=UPI000885D33C|nr:DUF3405 domain-containing protein [Belnapia rosea]SDB74754.1 hypothetical protein SAMN02927895_05456 [Belnapia rosea]
MERIAFVYYAHDVSSVRIREVRRLEQELPAKYDLFVVGCCHEASALASLSGGRAQTHSYTRDDLKKLPYPGRIKTTRWEDIRGGEDLTLMRFWRDHPQYQAYWFVEYDVRFTGKWGDFMEIMDQSKADLVCSLVSKYKIGSEWPHWGSFQPGESGIESGKMMSAFLPVCRASSAMMEALNAFGINGGAGHVEAIWGSVANAAGLSIEEIGGSGSFTPVERRGKFYNFADIPGVGRIGNFGAWPFYSDRSGFIHRKKNLLWHPVKD